MPPHIVYQDYSLLMLITPQLDVEETIKSLYGMKRIAIWLLAL